MNATTHEPLNLNSKELAILAELLELEGAKLLSFQYRYSGNQWKVFREYPVPQRSVVMDRVTNLGGES